MLDKDFVRKSCIIRRQTLSPEEVHSASHIIATKLLNDEIWRSSRSVALYSSIKNEVSTDSLLRQAWQEGKQVLLPRCILSDEPKLEFALCRGWEELVVGPFGILEPDYKRCIAVSCKNLPELIVVPAVGLTSFGARLGYGKGYYDKLLSKPGWNQILRVALVYQSQIVEFNPSTFDVPMHGYITELGFIWI